MKKLFLFLMIIGLSLSFGLVIHGAPETIEYNIEFYQDREWTIDNGVFVTNENYWATNRIKIVENEITLNNLNFNHILFWDRHGNYLGYMNTTGGGYEGLKYLDDTDVTVDIPLTALWFGLTAYELTPLELPQSVFSGDSLIDVFGVDYKTTDIANLNNQSLNDVFITGNLINGEIGATYFAKTETTTYIRYTSTRNTQTLEVQVIDLKNNISTNEKLYIRLKIKVNIINAPVILAFQLDGLTSGTNFSIIYVNVNNDIYTTFNNFIVMTSNDFVGDTVIKTYLFDTVNLQIGDYIEIDKTNGYLIISRDALGISSLTVSQMDNYYNAFVGDDILLEAFNDYNSLSFTQTDLDTWEVTYNTLVAENWANGTTALLFYSIEATYDREEIIEDDRTLPERINDGLDEIGLNSTLRFIIGLVVMVGVLILLGVLKLPTIVILIVEMLFFTLFTLMGWFQVWLVFIVSILLLLGIILKIKGGNI